MKRLIFILALCGTGFSAHAQSTDYVTAAEFGRMWARSFPDGATQVRNFPGGGTPIAATPTVSQLAGTKDLSLAKASSFPLASPNVTAPVNVVAKVPVAKLTKALKPILAAVPYVGTVIAIGSALKDWYDSSGISVNPNPTDPTKPYTRTVSGYASYKDYTSNIGGITDPVTWSWQSACSTGPNNPACTWGVSSWYSTPYVNTAIGCASGGGCVVTRTNAPGGNSFIIVPVGPVVNSNLPASMDDIAPYLESKQPPASVLKEILDKGGQVELDTPTVSGPATVAGPTSSKVTPTGTQTTTTNYNITYNGDKITVTQVTTTSNYNSSTGVTTTETTTEKEPLDLPSDTPLSDVPKLYEQKYPQGFAGIWTTRKAAFLATPIGSLTTQLMPTIGSGGSCPSWQLNLDLGVSQWGFGTHEVAPPCWVWDFGGVVIVISALLLARRMIFGG